MSTAQLSTHYRQEGVLDPDLIRDVPITLVGAGSLGSYTALALAKAGARGVTVWDDDKVETHNVGVQLYGPSAVRCYKVLGLRDQLTHLVGRSYAPRGKRQQIQSTDWEAMKGIVIVTVDSARARRDVWAAFSDCLDGEYLIDVRSGAQIITVVTSRPSDGHYLGTIPEDSEEFHEECTARATPWTSMIAGGLVAREVGRYLDHMNRLSRPPAPRMFHVDLSLNMEHGPALIHETPTGI